jgi:stage V sporulation protein B
MMGLRAPPRRWSLLLAIFHNFGSAMGSKVVSLLLGIVTYGIMARTLGTAGLGRYRTALTLLLFTGVLVEFGIYAVTLRDISQPGADSNRILGNAVTLRIIASTCAIAVLSICLNAVGVPAAEVLIAGIGWIALQLSELLRAVFQLKLAQHLGAIAEVAGAVVTLVLVAAFASMHGGTAAMLSATAAGFFCTALMSWRFANRLVSFRPHFDWKIWRGFLVAGLPIGGSLILQTIQLRVDVLLLALPRTPAELGLYDAPLKLYELLIAVPLLFGGLMLPLYVRDLGTRSSLVPRVNAALAVSCIFSMLSFAILLECGEPIVVLLAGPRFAASVDPLEILAASACFGAVTTTLRFAAVAMHQQARFLRADVVGMCAAVAAHAFLIPRYGIIGAAVGKLCGDVVTTVGACVIMRKLLGGSMILTLIVSMAAAACLIVAVDFAIGVVDVPWFVASAVCTPIILGSMLLLPRVRQILAPLGA